MFFSSLASLSYLNKVYNVCKYHNKDISLYRQNALPAVLNSRFWGMTNAMLSMMFLSIFLSESGRVCAGFYLQHGMDFDKETYLIKRGYLLEAVGILGILRTISALFSEENSAK